MANSALAGIRVLDVAGTVATGYCGKLFADHGADVINLEPAAGFATRQLAPFLPGVAPPENSALHAYLSTNKRSVVQTQALLEKLLATADVLLTSEDEPACQGYERSFPQLVVSSITWFGQTGPYADFRGSDAICQSLAGLVKGLGKPDSAPLLPSGYQAQIVGGLTAFIATMTQVLARELGNRAAGTHVDTSILEANLCFTEVGVVANFRTGLRGARWGINRFPPTYPLGIYPCLDGWLGVTALTPSQWLSFCKLIGLVEAGAEKRYLAVSERLADAELLDPQIAARLSTMSARQLFEEGQAARVPLALVPTMAELFETDQYRERQAFRDMSLPGGKTLAAPVAPFRLFRTPALADLPVSGLGADTSAVTGGLP
ncbi:MAG: CaiB/BaiF CoA transferase family protein [Pseudomonadota bacterium]